MPRYRYQGTTQAGKRAAGAVEASSEAEAKSRLRRERIRVIEIGEKKPVRLFALSGRVNRKHLSEFTRQFAAMSASGIPLVECLGAIAEQTENKQLQQIVVAVSSDVQAGASLAEALSRHPRAFNRLYCAMVKAGEAAGILDAIMLRLADYQEKSVALRRRITSALSYPALVMFVALGALVALFTFVVPTFSSMLSELGAKLPWSTQMVIALSDVVKTWFPAGAAIVVGLSFASVYFYTRNQKVRRRFDDLSLRMPVFGNLQKKNAVSRFARTFGALLSGGVPIAEALSITSNTAGNRVLEEGFLKTLDAIRGGQPLAQPLRETGIFPPMVIQMIAVGERSGKLPDMLAKISDYYDIEVDTAITTLTSVLEPVMIVVMGVVIAGVLISMYLPMFQMVSSLG
jgi:type IV pilus assembly protein PilC